MHKATTFVLTIGFMLAIVCPLLASAITVISFQRSFTALGQQGISSPSALSEQMAQNATTGLELFLLGMLGAAMVAGSGIVLHFLERPRRPSR